MNVILIVIGFVVGFFAGAIFIVKSMPLFGDLEVDSTNPERDLFKIAFTKDPNFIPMQKYIRFEVKDLSQEKQRQ